MTTCNANGPDAARCRAVLLSVGYTVCFAFGCSRWPGSDGRSAVALDLTNAAGLAAYTLWRADRPMAGMLLAAASFGLVELAADLLCVRCTGTLDYAVAGSWMVLASPWWMPLSWAVVAVQVGVSGDAMIRRCGLIRGAILSGLIGALLIPFYEEMAWGAHWWRYRNCLRIGHTPVYILVAEAVIAAGLALLGHFALRVCSTRAAVLLGGAAGLVTILGGVAGWGSVEFLGRGARPSWAIFSRP